MSKTQEIVAEETSGAGLSVAERGTDRCHLTHNGKPLLAFGCHFEHMLFVDGFDWAGWTDWAAEHGMNHCRTRLFISGRGDYGPFSKTADGRYDLTQWDSAYWDRFHAIISKLESRGIIVHLLIYPQGTGGTWWHGRRVYSPESNIHPETQHLIRDGATEWFWRTLSEGRSELYEIQTALLWKLIEESARYNNIYYDLCHEPFIHQMSDAGHSDAHVFFATTAERFRREYRKNQPDKDPIIGLDMDFTPESERRWVYGYDGFDIMIKGNNNDDFYTTAADALRLRQEFRKPFCPQECCDPPALVHTPGAVHENILNYHRPESRNHLRKYVWSWVMAKSQLIDIYQKGQVGDEKIENYEPDGHNPFENDALVLREFWDSLVDYPGLQATSSLVKGPGEVQMVLSSLREAVVYQSSEVGTEGVQFDASTLTASGLRLDDGNYPVQIVRPAAQVEPLEAGCVSAGGGIVQVELPEFVDDIAVHLLAR